MGETGNKRLGAGRGWAIPSAAPVMMAIAASALCAAPAAAQDGCSGATPKCGSLITRECLSSLGAGVMALGDAESCEKQMQSYRACLADVSKRCPGRTPQQDVSAEADRLEKLARLGGLIDAPKTVVEFYNNALVYSRRGDLLNGRAMLEKAIAAGARQVDVFQRYAQLLKAQEGLIGAREIMGDIARRQKDVPAAQMAQAILAPANRREAALRKIAEAGFAPAYFEISQLYSADRLGDQSRADQRAEKAALEAFQKADGAGKIYRWFLEKDTVEAWRESARRRLAVYQNRNLDVAPVSLTAWASNDSWSLTLQILETARAIRYSVDGGAKKSTGLLPNVHPQTGEKMPNPSLNLPLGTTHATIEVWYDNVRGEEEGPFKVLFNAKDAFVTSSKHVLGTMLHKWVEGRAWDEGSQLIYFTTLATHSCGLEKIEYGLEKETPDQVFPLQRCDPRNPHAVGSGAQTYLRLAKPAKFITVKLTYADGAASEVRRFPL